MLTWGRLTVTWGSDIFAAKLLKLPAVHRIRSLVSRSGCSLLGIRRSSSQDFALGKEG